MTKNIGLLLFSSMFSAIFCACDNGIEDTNLDYANGLGSNEDTFYLAPQILSELKNDEIDEASGIAASQNMLGTFWTHNDSGGENALFLFDKKGEDLGKVVLKGIDNRDWEDIAIGPGPKPNTSYLYVAEIGDNKAQYDDKYIYRFPEPQFTLGNAPQTIEITDIDTLAFQYPDGARDAEALLVHPDNGHIYIVTKREEAVHLYHLQSENDNSETLTPILLGTLPFNNVSAGDISPDGQEVLLKDYWRVYHWVVRDNDIAKTMLENDPVLLPYESEPQGEAITFDREMKGYYTISEERDNIPAVLYFYPRK